MVVRVQAQAEAGADSCLRLIVNHIQAVPGIYSRVHTRLADDTRSSCPRLRPRPVSARWPEALHLAREGRIRTRILPTMWRVDSGRWMYEVREATGLSPVKGKGKDKDKGMGILPGRRSVEGKLLALEKG